MYIIRIRSPNLWKYQIGQLMDLGIDQKEAKPVAG